MSSVIVAFDYHLQFFPLAVQMCIFCLFGVKIFDMQSLHLFQRTSLKLCGSDLLRGYSMRVMLQDVTKFIKLEYQNGKNC